jgi:outer membrane protein OmpA-like peptidoglycan-associated protein
MSKRLSIAMAVAATIAAGAQAQTQVEVDSGGSYHMVVVSRTSRAISYAYHNGTFKVNFQGTELMRDAAGEAKIESKRGTRKISAEFSGLDRPTSFGSEYLTYVLWAISPEGKSVNVGEVLVGDNHRSKLDVTTDLQAFALIVTAEPYFAVRQPSNVVILENLIGSGRSDASEVVDAKYELIDRGGYLSTGFKFDPLVLNARLPLEFYEARNAVRIAQSEGAERYATSTFQKAVGQMNEADTLAIDKHEDKKALVSLSREVVQTAEEAREITVKHIDEERVELERNASAARVANATGRAKNESNRRAAAEAVAVDAVQQRNEADRQNRNAQAAAQQATDSQMAAESARDSAQQQQHDAEANSDRDHADAINAQAAAASSDAQLQQAIQDREALRARLLQEFNVILQTRDTARGLVVNMSDVLFDSGKFTLRPLAREKLAKISGIVQAYPSLTLAVEGNTDSVGTDEFNQQLSEQRAESVRDYLTSQGVPDSSTTSAGFGRTRPIASNETSEGRQQNRRVEMIVSGEVIGSKLVSINAQPVAAITTP